MFHKNRYLIIASTIGVIAVAALILLYRQLALSTLINHETRSNVALTEVFSNSLWPDYRRYLLDTRHAGPDAQPDAALTARLHADVKRLMRGSNVVKVKIYDMEGTTLYSSDPAQIGENKSDNEGFIRARAGSPSGAITFRDQFDAYEGRLSEVNVVFSYIPIRKNESKNIEAVFEVYSDVTRLVHDMQKVQYQIVTGVLGSVALIYLLLISVARRADQIETVRQQEAARSEALLRYHAHHDPLTELPNRASFVENLDRAIKRAERKNSMLGVVTLDVDRFKLVNDSLGHGAGDMLLRELAARLHKRVRQGDSLFRLGGDEFAVLCEGLSSPGDAVYLAQRIIDATKEPFLIENQSIVTTTSIGIAVYPTDDVDPDKLIKNADAAMYLAKEEGRNRFRFYTRELNAHALERLALESALKQALGNEEFVLHYQPRVASDQGVAVGFEALLRWRRDGELVAPGSFLPVLEQTGLIAEVGHWVLREACRQCRAWQDAGFAPVRVSVNVSPLQFREAEFLDNVRAALADTGLDPRNLELELTESALLDNPENAIAHMQALKALGVTLSLDDFGTGFSSFSYLKLLPVDYLKIDQSFVRGLDQGSKDAAIIAAIAGVAHSLNIGLVAEGVERPTQLVPLVAEGCHELQGYLYSKPLPAERATDWLRRPTERNAVAT
ncbi:MAG: EAL domain-containing protein [Chromatiaceae bacterium]|nr:EAL domain-containing protein [Chromatiaceae bacterium]